VKRLNKGFLGPDLGSFEYASSRFAVLPVPYEGTVTMGKGTSKGPGAIVGVSSEIELFDMEIGRDFSGAGFATLKPLAPGATPQEMVSRVEQAVRRILADGKFPVTLGGEHSISTGAVRALAARENGLSVLVIDAHADLRDSYKGSKHNHACASRRMGEYAPVVQAGLRNISDEEAAYAAREKIAQLWFEPSLRVRDWIDRALSALSENVYVSIDLDGLDPSIMPAVGTPEPGGMGWLEIMDLLAQVSRRKRVVGFDVVELSPIKGLDAPQFLAAKLIYKFAGYVLRAEHPEAV